MWRCHQRRLVQWECQDFAESPLISMLWRLAGMDVCKLEVNAARILGICATVAKCSGVAHRIRRMQVSFHPVHSDPARRRIIDCGRHAVQSARALPNVIVPKKLVEGGVAPRPSVGGDRQTADGVQARHDGCNTTPPQGSARGHSQPSVSRCMPTTSRISRSLGDTGPRSRKRSGFRSVILPTRCLPLPGQSSRYPLLAAAGHVAVRR